MLATWINRSDRSQGKSAYILPIELEDTRPVEVQRLILRFGSLLLVAVTIWFGPSVNSSTTFVEPSIDPSMTWAE